MYRFSCFFILIFVILVPSQSFASVAGEVNKANDLYKQGKFDDSLSLYQAALDQDDKSSVVKYDLGTALYKNGNYEKALQYLQQAAQAKNIKIKPKAEYNLGNVLYKSGVQKENTNVDQAIKSLQDALVYYNQAINDDPKDQDAVYNQNFVKREIERLKQKKQEQQQQQQDHQQSQDQKNQDQKNQQRQQNKRDQKNQQQRKQDQQKQEQQSQAKQSKPQDQKNNQSANQSPIDKQKKAQEQADAMQKQVDRKQAEDLLEDYRENEEPKKLLNYTIKKIDDRPVLKDW